MQATTSSALILFTALALAGCDPKPSASFVGVWNYTHPDAATGTGIAALSCPAGPMSPAIELPLPQIGWIEFTATGDEMLSGTTDQGCTWSFAVDDGVASISPAGQSCFNANIGSSYTIDAWTLTLGDPGELAESLQATSHQAVDCAFDLAAATRHAYEPTAGDHTAPFVGVWAYDPPDASAGNVALLACPGAMDEPPPPPSYVPQFGTLTVARADDDTISITTDGGCVSTLAVREQTAELVAAPDACDGGVVPFFWSFETDGDDAYQTISAMSDGCMFVLSNSHLTPM